MNWLLLRGLSRESEHWEEFPKKLAGSQIGGTVVALDLVGFGTESERKVPLSIGEMAIDAHRRWRLLSQGPYGIIGLSLGGMVALEWIDRFPEEVLCGVLINSSAANVSSVGDRLSLAAFWTVAKAFLQREPALRELHILRMISNHRSMDQALVERWVAIAKRRPTTRVNVLRQLVAGARFQAPRTIPCPLLVLASELDKFVSVKCSKALAAKYNAPLAIHSTAGHDLPLDDTPWVLTHIQNFLSSQKLKGM